MSCAVVQQKSRGVAPGLHQKTQANHSLSFHQVQQDFIDAMAAAGIAPADAREIIADGTLHRFRVDGDRPGTRNGYFTLHLDGIPAGHFGSWKHGVSQTWSAKNRNEMTRAERDEQRRRMEASRRAAAAEQQQRHREAAERALTIWSSSKPAPAEFPYLVKKSIAPGIARIRGDVLVLPIVDAHGTLRSLQFIDAAGGKRFLSGGQKKACFVAVQAPERAARTIICEGFATGSTLAEIEPQARVIAALDAGNLESVALAIRGKYPDAEILIACDNDRATPGNPGVTKGRAAAIQAGAKLLIPRFPDDAPLELSDFNDLVRFIRHGGRTHA